MLPKVTTSGAQPGAETRGLCREPARPGPEAGRSHPDLLWCRRAGWQRPGGFASRLSQGEGLRARQFLLPGGPSAPPSAFGRWCVHGEHTSRGLGSGSAIDRPVTLGSDFLLSLRFLSGKMQVLIIPTSWIAGITSLLWKTLG